MLVACTGSISSTGTGAATPDAPTGSGSSIGSGGQDAGSGSSSGSGGGADAGNGCVPQVPAAQLGDGHHNAGQDCMNGCHNHGFTVAGTIFTSTTSTTAVSGTTVRVVDANNQTVDIVSQLNGNFYTSTAVTFPLTVLATSCPTVDHMTATVTSSGTIGCNKNGCHTSGNWIHIP